MEPTHTPSPEQFAQVWERVQQSNGGSSMIQPIQREPSPCLGENSRCHLDFLQGEIRSALTDHHTIGLLSGYGPGGQVLRSIAGDKLRQAKRLSTAQFLISGRLFFPWEVTRPLRYSTWPEGMRMVFHRAQETEERLRRAEGETRDRCLQELFDKLAQEEHLHALRLRTVLEMW